MVKEIIQIGDERLNEVSTKVEPSKIASREIQDLIQDLVDTCTKHAESSAGLSGVQIGMMQRVYVIRRVDKEVENEAKPVEWNVLINPEVTMLGQAESIMWEGCMSVGTDENRLFAPVLRHDHVKVKYLDKDGKPQELDAQGYLAHIVQHEQDHIDGKLFLRYVTNPANIWKGKELDDYVQKYQAYPPVA